MTSEAEVSLRRSAAISGNANKNSYCKDYLQTRFLQRLPKVTKAQEFQTVQPWIPALLFNEAINQKKLTNMFVCGIILKSEALCRIKYMQFFYILIIRE